MNPYQAARRGARFLDTELPRWAEIVDPKKLALDDCFSCVLGQLFGEFEAGTDWLELVHGYSRPAWFGFDVDDKAERTWKGNLDYWDALEDAWCREIEGRVSADIGSGANE